MSDASDLSGTAPQAASVGIVLPVRTLSVAPAAQINFVTWSASGSRQVQGSARRGRRWGSRSPKATNQLTVSANGISRWGSSPELRQSKPSGKLDAIPVIC